MAAHRTSIKKLRQTKQSVEISSMSESKSDRADHAKHQERISVDEVSPISVPSCKSGTLHQQTPGLHSMGSLSV